MPNRMQVPTRCWPRSAADLETLDARLGGRTSYVIGPRVERDVPQPDGSVRRLNRPAYVELWLEFEPEASAAPPTAEPPEDERVRGFLADLARRSAKAWAELALATPRSAGAEPVPYTAEGGE